MDPYDRRPMRRTLGGLLMVLRASTPAHHTLRSRVAGVAMFSVAMDVVCSGLAWLLERGHGDITTYWNALFWTTTQMLTVSSQFPNPRTTGGKLLDVWLELYAVVVVTTVAGAFASFFHHRSGDRARAQAAAQ